MDKLRILVTTIGGLTSPDVLKALRTNGEREVFLLGCDAFNEACGRYFVDHFELSPNSSSDEESFVAFVIKIVEQYAIDLIIPCGNEDNLALAKHKASFSIPILVGEYSALTRAYDKGSVYECLRDNATLKPYAPKFMIVSSWSAFLQAIITLGYPDKKVVIKPRLGRGGRGVYILSDKNDRAIFSAKPTNEMPLAFFEHALKDSKFGELIVMEFLQEPFYSTYSLCKNGQNLLTLTHQREWGNASQTYRGKVYYDAQMQTLCAHIISAFALDFTNNMELGTTSDGRIVLFDLNPRLGASSGIDTYLGINFAYLAAKIALNEPFSLKDPPLETTHRFYRYFEQWWKQA